MPKQKIDFKGALDALVKEVTAIEASQDEQREKTRRIKAAGQRFINAIYADKRRFSGESGHKKQISLNTLNTYLSRARRVFEDMGLRHHLLDRDLARLKARYPGHADQISTLEGLPAAETRLAHKALVEQLQSAELLRELLARIDFSHGSAAKRVRVLVRDHGAYAVQLEALLGKEAQKAMASLQEQLREVPGLIEDLSQLKINHEIMYALVMPPALRASHTARKEGALAKKKRSVVALDYTTYMQRIYNLLTNPTVNTGDGTRYGIAPLGFAVCAATGRRPIEVLVQGEFEAIDSHLLRFHGQAKKRSGDDPGRDIYSLVDTKVVMEAITNLRAIPEVANLKALEPESGDYRSFNVMVNQRTAAPLNRFAKEFFGDPARVFKDVRAIYAAIAYRAWFETDPRWKKKDADVFFAELLGHDDETTQMHYKQWKLANFDPQFLPQPSGRESRLAKLERLDELMPGLANGDAAVKLHENVKALLKEDPNAKITQSMINRTRTGGYYRPTLKRYLETCAEALGIEQDANGRWKQADEAEPPVMVEIQVDEDELEGDALASDEHEPVKPRFKSQRIANGRWAVQIYLGEEEVAQVTGKGTQVEVMQQAWAEYQATLVE